MEVGATLREARMRQRISIEEVEEQTKIRAKYLRALENEDWDLLPGKAYVRSFLRTYAEVLGLDAQVLIDSYRRVHERGPEGELYGDAMLRSRRMAPGPSGRASAPSGRRSGPRPPRGPLLPRPVLIGGGIVGLLLLLGLLGQLGDDPDQRVETNGDTAAQVEEQEDEAADADAEAEQRERRRQARRERERRIATLTIRATGSVYVCVQDATGELVVPGRTLEAGDVEGPFRSRRLLVILGNNNVSMRVNGDPHEVAPSAEAIGLRIEGRSEPADLPPDDRPDCT